MNDLNFNFIKKPLIGCFLIFWFFLGCSTSIPQIPVKATFFGQAINTTLDSEIAKYYIENYLTNKRSILRYDQKIDHISHKYLQSLPDRDALKAISENFSVDFAALFFARCIWQNETNQAIEAHFRKSVIERKIAKQKNTVPLIENSDAYIILFVPGWDYKDNGHKTGADFAAPQKLMTEIGFKNHLIEIPPNGSVRENATFLAKKITHFSQSSKEIILVGASSAGPAIHLALGELVPVNALENIKAWINLGGILQGSPLIDYLQEWPRSWLLQTVLWAKGWEKENMLSMASKPSQERFLRLVLPEHLLVLNYVGLSLSGEISQFSDDKYPILRSKGPNDGLTLLADILAPNSITIIALGSDHFFNEDPEINLKTVALAQTVIEHLENLKTK